MKKKIVIFFVVFLTMFVAPGAVLGQGLKGTVKDINGPLEGVSVSIRDNSSMGTFTDKDGVFRLEAKPGQTLLFSHTGYKNKELLLNDIGEIEVVMSEDRRGLEEVVVVGYGKQRKMTLTGAVSSISGSELTKQLSPDFGASLKGLLPGLTVVQGTGMPGDDDAALYLRGVATTNGVNPLILIDGVFAEMSRLRQLDPFSVASVSVLKDASATAVFGVRGANGVIIITTKRGEAGKVTVSASTEQSLQQMAYLPDRLPSYEYVHLRNEALANDGMPAEYSAADIAQYESWKTGKPADSYWYPDNNWVAILFRKYAPLSRTNVNLSGGTERLRYFASVGYLTQSGLFNVEPESYLKYDAQTKVNRYNFRANVDFDVTKAIKLYANLSGDIERVNNSNLLNGQFGFATLFVNALTSRPTDVGPLSKEGVPVYMNSELQPLSAGRIVADKYGTGSSYGDLNRSGYTLGTRSGFDGKFGLDYNLDAITPGLKFGASAALTSLGSTRMTASKNYVVFNYQDITLNNEPRRVYVVNRGNETEDNPLSLSKSSASSIRVNLQGQFNYSRNFGKHAVGGLVLFQRDYWEAGEGSGYEAPYLPFNIIGLSGRATYGYDNRYLLEFNVGYNGSEQFSPKKRFGFFPALSGGWVVSNEAFLKQVRAISNLKFRYSYGFVGNDLLGASRFLYLDNVVIGGTGLYGADVPTLGGAGNKINEVMIGNPDITWERAKKQNAGMDLSFVNGLSFTADFYQENRTGILLRPQTVPDVLGLPQDVLPVLNLGEIDNRGMEFLLGYKKPVTKDFSLNTSVNFSYNKNKVLFYDEPLRGEDYVYRKRIEGFSLGQQWGYRIDRSVDPAKGKDGSGFFNSQEDITKSGLNYLVGTPKPGDFIYTDQNGDGIIDEKDMVPIGQANLPNISYGMQVDIQYKNFDCSLLMQGVSRSSKYYEGPGVFEEMGSASFYPWQLNRWSAERYQQHAVINHPRLATTASSSHIANDYYIMNTSYLRLRNVVLGYTLPQPFTKRFARSVRVYVNATNLLTWDRLKMDSFDPEQANGFVYPLMKNYNLGVNINFN
ncbi:SusC/RagA family TonB-linked outer membrane protein [Niabella drilacis]|uniref:TonB-linked outer membrane protein, SusC/RagA family n=1 Tax=Niabella drilacis (strain DSM 25811 / CCM 8410 / CCUG 62505 / LMG 26954 / E90) TaxID=1285928 RepID=A0A1G6JG25_NIADE|nr:TonB-dependent receptor [Niabella drilacis]SDC17637.1 TonB-linked outer membrane protein, SusC/RagA family [Niabella drilacis]